MFRARVAAQGFTVIAMVAGSMYYSKDREKSKELRKLKEDRENEEKRQRWIRELEIRDEEDKMMRAALQKRIQRSAESSDDPAASNTESGGILGRMGLWPREEQAKSDASLDDAPEVTKPKRDNPNSSLGAIGEALASKKREERGSEPKN